MDEQFNAQYHVQDNSDTQGSIISAARKHYHDKNYNEALKLLLSTAHTTTDSEVYLEIGSCYYMLSAPKEALEYWNKAVELNPKNSKAYANIGNLHYKNKNTELAISFWLIALIATPEDAKTCLNLAVAFNEKDMRFEAIKYFEKYLKYCEDKTSPDYLKVKENITHCYDVANQYLIAGAELQSKNDDKNAAACYFKSLANYPNLATTNMNLGSIFFSDRNLELAVKYWKVASHLEPNREKIYANLAISYDLMKQFDYAYCYYYRYMNFIMGNKEEYYKTNQRLIKIKPFLNENSGLIESHLKKAQDHIAKSEFYEAIDEYKNYSILKPEEQHVYKEMIKKIESYLNPEINIISACFETGNKLINEGKFSEAKLYFWRIMRLSSPEFLEFSKAKAKYSQCEKMQ